jgi:hypothetical protein
MYSLLDVEVLPSPDKNLIGEKKFLKIRDRYFWALIRNPRETDPEFIIKMLEAMGETIPDALGAVFESDSDGNFLDPNDDGEPVVGRYDGDYDALVTDLLVELNS